MTYAPELYINKAKQPILPITYVILYSGGFKEIY